MPSLACVPVSSTAAAVTVFAGLLSHQVFRRFETYSVSFHLAILVIPPGLISAVFSSPLSSLCAVYVSILVLHLWTVVLSVLTYRVSPFHPLARYPGPVFLRLSKLAFGILSLGGQSHKYIKSLHDQYGDVVRIGPNELSICDPSLVDTLLDVPKGPHYLGRQLDHHTQMMTALQDTEEHVRRRRPWLRAMSPTALRDYHDLLGSRIVQMISCLENQKGAIELNIWFDYFTYDFMSDMAFGSGPELLETGDKNNFWSILATAARVGMLFSNMPWLGPYIRCFPPLVAPLNTLFDRCKHLVRERIQRGSKTRDLFHYLNHEDTPSIPPPPISHLVDDGVLAVVAGADTTASALTSLFACLLAHPDVHARLVDEVDMSYPPGQDVLDPAFQPEMPYLDAIINETLRLFPPLPSGTQRQVPHNGRGIHVGSIYIPPGTSFWLHAYTLHRDVRNFSPSPTSFLPTRWLTSPHPTESHSSSNQTAPTPVHDMRAFIPFSRGALACVGMRLARLELRAVVCALLQRFRVYAAPRTGELEVPREEMWDWKEKGVRLLDLEEYDSCFQDFLVTLRAPVTVVLEMREGK